MRASGSAKTVNASANPTPCFFAFASAFAASHSNSKLFELLWSLP